MAQVQAVGKRRAMIDAALRREDSGQKNQKAKIL
jgi:hypothetical protein